MIHIDFNPHIRHPYYFLRGDLFNAINKHKSYMTGRMMDFGCGSKPYKSLFNVSEYIGLDYNGEGHPHDNEDIDHFYDGKKIPFEDNYFDSIFSTEVFEHVFNLEEILIELNRVLKPGGKLLFTCPFSWIEHEAPNDYARYTRFALKNMMEKAGFKVIVEEKTGDYISTMTQLKVFYNCYYLLPKLWLYKVPIIKNILYHFFVTKNNLIGLLKQRVLPNSKDLYLNNVFIIEKK